MYAVVDGRLSPVDPAGSPNRWAFATSGIVTAPIVSGGTLFVGSGSGMVYGVSTSAGAKVWSAAAGTSILGPDEQNADVLVGMAVGGRLLVVPAANKLTVVKD